MFSPVINSGDAATNQVPAARYMQRHVPPVLAIPLGLHLAVTQGCRIFAPACDRGFKTCDKPKNLKHCLKHWKSLQNMTDQIFHLDYDYAVSVKIVYKGLHIAILVTWMLSEICVVDVVNKTPCLSLLIGNNLIQ